MTRSEENTWRQLQGLEMQRSVKEIIAEFKSFVDTYYAQNGYSDEHTDKTIINDILYGLGKAISEEHRYTVGYTKFKKKLIETINNE